MDLTEELVERLGRAFALTGAGHVLVGRDTRSSGPALEQALARGILSAGAEVFLGGVLPTPAVALLNDDVGAVVSASHNPAEYNGVKFFDAGWKLSDEDEEAIEAHLDDPPKYEGGEIQEQHGLAEEYADLVGKHFGVGLDGLRIAVDSANGAMSAVAPGVFQGLGAAVTPVANEPDGTNINAGCGATDLTLLAGVVREGDFDLGVAFDGDGDRMLAVDAAGRELDGDQIVAILALHLGVDLVAITQMTNLGFHRLMAERGIRVVTTDVGDKYVLRALVAEGGVLGGEQSGHVIYLDYARGHTTGDGLVAALLLCRAVVESGASIAELAAVMPRFPQVKRNVRVARKEVPASVRVEVERVNDELAGRGRVLVRPSGTEPVIRILAEAEAELEAANLCGTIEHLVLRELG